MELLNTSLGHLKAAGSRLCASLRASLARAATSVQGGVRKAVTASYVAYVVVMSFAVILALLVDALSHLRVLARDLRESLKDAPLLLSPIGWRATVGNLR